MFDLLGSQSHACQVLGGDSAVNGLVWVRPPEAEYDAWEALGNSGWNWDSMYAAMKKVTLSMAECEQGLI